MKNYGKLVDAAGYCRDNCRPSYSGIESFLDAYNEKSYETISLSQNVALAIYENSNIQNVVGICILHTRIWNKNVFELLLITSLYVGDNW